MVPSGSARGYSPIGQHGLPRHARGRYVHGLTRARLPRLKFIATSGVFLLLHFCFETFPNVVFRVIGEEGETTFFRMKMLFFAYLFTSIVEFLVRRRGLASVG